MYKSLKTTKILAQLKVLTKSAILKHEAALTI